MSDTSRVNNSPFLRGDDEQIVEEEEVDRVELHPHVENRCPFGHFLQLPLLLQISGLGDDGDGLEKTGSRFKCSQKKKTILAIPGYTLSLSNSSD